MTDQTTKMTSHPLAAVMNDGWTPANEAAKALANLAAVGHDLSRLGNIVRNTNDIYDKRLIFKQFVVEFVSFMDNLECLLALVNQLPIHQPGEFLPRPGILQEDLTAVRAVAKVYHRERARTESKVRHIRNKVGAHREQIDWVEMAETWSNVQPAVLQGVYEAAFALYTALSDLPIYQYFRACADGTYNFSTPFPRRLFDETA